jgi:hypothetical protein
VVIIGDGHYILSSEEVTILYLLLKISVPCLKSLVQTRLIFQLSWFGAQKFCRRGGWLMGSVTSAAFETEIASLWRLKLSMLKWC